MNGRLQRILRLPLVSSGIGPFLGYALCYFILTFPLVLRFGHAYFCDDGDGPLFIWDVWIVRTCLLKLWQLPWHTDVVHFPHGTSLLLHTLTPFNGLIAALLWVLRSPVLVYNTIVTFTFAMSGLTTFWLARAVSKSYWPSIAAGFGFAFCSFRFAHAVGHLHVISTEWTPLYVLALITLLSRPSVKLAMATAFILLLVLLCDQYQFITCVLATAVIAIARLRTFDRRTVVSGIAFVIAVALFCGPIAIGTLIVGHREPLVGLHHAESFSADFVNPFVPGWTWNYRGLTKSIWQPIGSYIETSVSIGPAVLIAALFGIRKLTRSWLALAILFIALSFGPTLFFMTHPITRLTPYRLLEWLAPSLKLAGNPARMIVMAQLGCCVLAAVGLTRLREMRSRRTAQVVGAMFTLALVIGSQPHVTQTFEPEAPRWVYVLRDQPGDGAVIDLISCDIGVGLYAQTIHHRKMAAGDTSRTPASVDAATKAVLARVEQGKFDELGAMGFGYIVQPASSSPLDLPIVFEDKTARIYRLK